MTATFMCFVGHPFKQGHILPPSIQHQKDGGGGGTKENVEKAVNPDSCKTVSIEKHLQRAQVCLADPLRTQLSHIRAAVLNMWAVTFQ